MQFSIGSVSALAALQGSKKSLQSDRFMVAEPDRALGATLGVWPWRLPTAAGAAGMGPAVGPGGLIDTKAYGKLKQIDGKEENWATWCLWPGATLPCSARTSTTCWTWPRTAP